MKKTNWGALCLMIIMLFSLTACSEKAAPKDKASHSTGQIYLYGEAHAKKTILKKELETWYDHYHNEGMRHLFTELSYCSAEFLNIWMESDNDDILETLFDDWAGTQGGVSSIKDFYKQIKADCPETVFHGIDVGHQYDTTEKRFLEYLEQNGLDDTEQYTLAQEGVEQGKHFRETSDFIYRENTMTENFIREFDSLDGESVMGIYGAAHTGLNALDFTGTIPCMGNQLKKHYSDIVHSKDLDWVQTDMKPSKTDIIEVNGKSYEASYFGLYPINGRNGHSQREYWRLENAYDDFKDQSKTGECMSYNSYPMTIEDGQIFVIDITKTDGATVRQYYRSDGIERQGETVTEEFTIE